MRSLVPLTAVVALSLPLLGTSPVPPASPTRAVAGLSALKGSGVAGEVSFAKVDGGVKVTAKVSGLSAGPHGFHIHEFGDCSASDGSSAGGHFNPAGHNHGAPKDAERHAGDLGNIEASKDGTATLEWLDPTMTLDGASSILGRGVIVHEKADDLKTQPTGAAGGRVACGVIGVAKAQ